MYIVSFQTFCACKLYGGCMYISPLCMYICIFQHCAYTANKTKVLLTKAKKVQSNTTRKHLAGQVFHSIRFLL